MPRQKKVTPIKQAEIKIGGEILSVSVTLAGRIKGLHDHVTAFTAIYAKMTAKKGEFAEEFMDVWSVFNSETGRSFVDFVRAIDPTVPGDREGYRNHATYQAAEYLRRSQVRRAGGGGARQVKPARTNARARMARLLATILAACRPEDHEEIWRGVADELALTANQVGSLKTLTGQVQPLFKLQIRRPVPAEVVHMPEPAARATAAA